VNKLSSDTSRTYQNNLYKKNLLMIKKTKLSKQLLVIFPILLFHLLGVLVTFFRTDIPFHYHLLRFFSWWSVHTSIFTVLSVVIILRKRKKAPLSYFSQFITFLATIYNLITFFFWVYCLFFLSVGWESSFLFNFHLFAWHFIAPLLTIFYFYLYARADELKKKLTKTFLFSFLAPVFYFFYV
jgi:hypothetical protein